MFEGFKIKKPKKLQMFMKWWKQSCPGRILAKFAADNLPAYSAQAAFFLFLSIFPIIILTSTLIRYTPLTDKMLISIIDEVIPGIMGDTLIGWVNEIYTGGLGYISFSIIFILWSASKSFIGIIDSLDNIYKPETRYPRIINRIRATICTVLFMVFIVFAGILLIFGTKFSSWIKLVIPVLPNFAGRLIDLRSVVAISVFFIILVIMYVFLTQKTIKPSNAVPGALFTTLGWFVFSYLYSIYIDKISNGSSIYGSITAIVFLMLWLYFCMYIFLVGAELNHYITMQSSTHQREKKIKSNIRHRNCKHKIM